MKRKSNKHIFFILSKGMGVLLIVFIFMCVFSVGLVVNNNSLIQKKFQGNKSSFQGIVELWCISSFESGTMPVKNHLESVAVEFEKQNKGAFILILNMSADECKKKMESGAKPDIICFSGDFGKNITSDLIELEENSTIRNIMLESARLEGGELLAYPYALGGYALITTDSRLERSGMIDKQSIFSNCLNLGYEKKLKKTTKNIYSLCYGTKNNNSAESALFNEAKVRGISFSQNNLSLHKDISSLTGYGAYSRFIDGECVILLGTQRDIARISNREKMGRETGFCIDYISYFSDLLNYVGVINTSNDEKLNFCRAFAKFLTLPTIQNKLSKIGLFKTTNDDELIYEDKYFLQMEKSLKHLDYVPNIFN